MKNKITQLILLFCLLFAFPIFAADEINIEFEQTPLFNNANLAPGQTETRWIKIKNTSNKPQNIAIKAINFCACEQEKFCLNNILFLQIKNSQNQLYYDSLTNFFNLNQVFLSELNNTANIQYDINVYFDEQAEDEYQNLTTCFDLIIGATESEQSISTSDSSSSYYSYYKPDETLIIPDQLETEQKNYKSRSTKQTSKKLIPTTQKITKKINSIIAGAKTKIQTTTPTSTIQTEPIKKQFSNLIYLRILVFAILIFLIKILTMV